MTGQRPAHTERRIRHTGHERYDYIKRTPISFPLTRERPIAAAQDSSLTTFYDLIRLAELIRSTEGSSEQMP